MGTPRPLDGDPRVVLPLIAVCRAFLALVGALVAILAWPTAGGSALSCGLPETPTTWIDFADSSVSFWRERFARPGVVRLFCDIHSEMGGVIVVVDTPYFTRPDADGRFRIANVAEGEYTAVVWHETAGTTSSSGSLRAGSRRTRTATPAPRPS